jgi:hypothetical protein
VPLLEQKIKELYDNGRNLDDSGKMINEFHHNRVCDLMKDHGGTVAVGNAHAH